MSRILHHLKPFFIPMGSLGDNSPCLSLILFLVLAACNGIPDNATGEALPNILILVADDLGYSDLGCFGGEISTPNIDRLATHGIRFSRFHTAPMCAPSRAMLLSGNDHHIAGVGRQGLEANVFGYEGHLTQRVITIPDLLRKNGYHTYMAGKWHLGMTHETNPSEMGFEHSFVLLEGVGDHFNSQGIFGNQSRSHYTEDGRIAEWPEGRYSTDVYTDKLLAYLDENRDNRPFFAYAAFTAPHWPLQVDKKYWQKYQGRYAAGYEALREERFKQLKMKGLIPDQSILPALHPSVKPWKSLTAAGKEKECRKMEIYAGMTDNLDANIGRIINYLKASGKYENTLIFFISDNGAAGEDYYGDAEIRPYINDYFNDHFDAMGTPESLVSYGPPWAETGTAAFRFFKGYTTNGGIITPMIVSGSPIVNKGSVRDIFVSVMDIAPTIYEVSGIAHPREWNGHAVYPLRGASMYPLLSGAAKTVHPDSYVYALEHAGHSMLRKGNWKITNNIRPFSEANFGLYDLSNDPGENHDLKYIHPEKYRELLKEWAAFSGDVRLQLPR